ncbi:response regulator [Magnetospirillum sp. SS-4]|uniref:response regulator n=1 Tax=Magnetospirillum sp. SS-4 TaxID=2681465 RepID=UPI0013821CA5|nr:response regulator [Magnetospirillum sp. SS-4]CAA7626081.1 Putative two-component response regulator (modular protein) [Magnetospirillum sp. SS-4]
MTHDFQSVRALLRNPDPVTRKIVTGTLGNHGCRQIVVAEHGGEVEHHLKSDMIDLLICDADQGLQDACDSVRQMRNRADGDNAFALSVILTSRPDPETVTHLIDSGTDSILVKPFQPATLAMQIDTLIRSRRPFVITRDYVGPERRADGMRPGTESAPRLQVPNPLRETVTGGANRDELRRRVRAAWEVVNEHRIERQAVQLIWLANRIRAALQARPPAEEAASLIAQLLHCTSELRLRVAGCGFDHVAHLATTMIEIAYGLGHNIDNPDSRWLSVLPKVADAIGAAFTRERDAVRSSRQISQTISRHAHRRESIAAN